MGMKSKSAHFGRGAGGPSTKTGKSPIKINEDYSCKSKQKIFDKTGHVTFNSISSRREFFLGKSVGRLEHELNKNGYETIRRASTHRGSKAKFIVTLNSAKERNITQIQVSPGRKDTVMWLMLK